MTDLDEARERALAVLAGFSQTCPDYPELPCWACAVLHVFTGVIRSVTDGRFNRFERYGAFDFFDPDSLTPARWEEWGRSPGTVCPHHPRARGKSYWRSPDASTTLPYVLEKLDRYWAMTDGCWSPLQRFQ